MYWPENPRKTVPKAIKAVFLCVHYSCTNSSLTLFPAVSCSVRAPSASSYGVLTRLLSVYVLGSKSGRPPCRLRIDISLVWVISVLVPSDDSRLLNGGGTATSSPFVIAINNACVIHELSRERVLTCMQRYQGFAFRHQRCYLDCCLECWK
jgi:hypothetical protein